MADFLAAMPSGLLSPSIIRPLAVRVGGLGFRGGKPVTPFSEWRVLKEEWREASCELRVADARGARREARGARREARGVGREA